MDTARDSVLNSRWSYENNTAFAELIDSASFPVYVCDSKTDNLMYMNKIALRMSCISESEYTGRKCYEVLMHHKCACSFCNKKKFTDKCFTGKLVYLFGDTKKMYMVNGKKIIYNGRDANLIYISGKTTETELAGKLQKLIDRIPGGISIFEIDDDSVQLIYVNNAYRSLLGDTTKYIGINPVECVYSEDRIIFKNTMNQLRNGKDSFDIHMRITDINREISWIRLVGSVIERINGKLTVYCCYSDFDVIMKTQQELQSNRAMLDAAMTSAKVLAWKYDFRTKKITDSGYIGIMPGLPGTIEDVPESLIKMGCIASESVTDIRDMFSKIPHSRLVSCDICIVPPDSKKPVWQRQIYTQVTDSRGNYIESIGTSIDVTEQKEREKSYEEQIRLKRLLSNNAKAAAHYNLSTNMVTDSESQDEQIREIMNTESVNELLGRMKKNVRNDSEKKIFESVDSCSKIIEKFRNGENHISLRHHLARGDEWYETSFDIISNPYTGNIEAIAVLHDITELVITEEIVKRLMDIEYESIASVNVLTGEAKPFRKANNNSISRNRMSIRYNISDARAYLEKYCCDPDAKAKIARTSIEYLKKQLEKEDIHTETFTLRRDGTETHKRVIYTYLNEDKKIILCAVQDTTEIYRHEIIQKKKLSDALTQAEKANKAKTSFFARMSHDMRTPMNGILGLAELSAEEKDLEILRSNMKKIKESGNYLLSLINDTLDWQRIESGKMNLDTKIVSAKTIVENIIDIIRPSAKAKKISLTVNYLNADLGWYVRLDPVRVKQIFINILSNSVKFTPVSGRINIELCCTGRDGLISHNRVRISDTGIGMSEEFIRNGLFKPFSQEYANSDSDYSGSGLGMSIVHRLIELMKGSIEVESRPGYGTVFTVYLDFLHVSEDEAVKYFKTKENKQHVMKKTLQSARILLIEDHPLNAEIARRMLERMGCSVTWKDNGRKGLDEYASSEINEYDAVLMDVRMPVMNGLDAARAIRSLDRSDAVKVPIIAMTANAYEEDVSMCVQAGMNYHLSKPFEPSRLFEVLVKFINN